MLVWLVVNMLDLNDGIEVYDSKEMAVFRADELIRTASDSDLEQWTVVERQVRSTLEELQAAGKIQ